VSYNVGLQPNSLLHSNIVFCILILYSEDSLAVVLHSVTLSTENAPPPNPPNLETQLPPYLAVQIQIEILTLFECVPRNLSFWLLGV